MGERERERESEAAASKEDRRPAAAPDRPKLSALSLARKKRRHLVVSGKKARGKLAWLRPKLRNRMGEIIPNTSSEFAPLLNFPNSVISSGGHFDREGAPHIQPPSVQECRLHCRRDLRHLAGDFPQILLLLRPSARPLAVYQLRSSQTCNVAHSARQNLVRNAQSLKMPIAVGRGQTDRRTRDLPPPPSIYMIPSGGAGSQAAAAAVGRREDKHAAGGAGAGCSFSLKVWNYSRGRKRLPIFSTNLKRALIISYQDSLEGIPRDGQRQRGKGMRGLWPTDTLAREPARATLTLRATLSRNLFYIYLHLTNIFTWPHPTPVMNSL